MNKRGRKAQLKLSFGMIFSIILIIIFISFAVFGILKFLEIQDTLKAEKFMRDLQIDIDNMWKSSKGSQKVSYYASKDTEALCFEYQTEESEDPNMYFIPEDIGDADILHVNWGETQGNLERKCFVPNEETRKIELILVKDYGEIEVTIREPPEPVP